MREHLTSLFRYDLWANSQWIETLGDFPDPKPARDVMEHILRAQQIWIGRCLSEEIAEPSFEDLSSLSRKLNDSWCDLLKHGDPNAFIAYENLKGEPFISSLETIASHVANHGTYHRGQLRAMAEAVGIAFPETDLILFSRLSAHTPA